jgi:hypothetical protein
VGGHREGDALARNALGAMMRAVASGCTLEHLAAVTGFDVEVVKRLLHKPRREFNGRHPTDRHAPGQEQSTGDTDRSLFVSSGCVWAR